jgi:hypothetical protein
MERIIIRDHNGNQVRSSRNLRGIVEHMRRRLVKVVGLSQILPPDIRERFPKTDGRGKLMILWEDGTSVETEFMSFGCLCEWVRARSWLRGSPLVIDGVDGRHEGKLDKGNEVLRSHCRW